MSCALHWLANVILKLNLLLYRVSHSVPRNHAHISVNNRLQQGQQKTLLKSSVREDKADF